MKAIWTVVCVTALAGCGDDSGAAPGSCGAFVASGDAGAGQDVDAGTGPEGCADAGAALGAWSCVPSGTVQSLYRVWGSGSRDVWAVGAGGAIVHWDGAAWSGIRSGTVQDLYGVWGSGPRDVWAVGGAGTILHWDGCAWSPATSDTVLSTALNGVWGSGPDDVWAVGAEILHFGGTTWSSTGWAFPGTTASGGHGTDRNDVFPQMVFSVWGSGPKDVWAVGSDCTGTTSGDVISIACTTDNILHWNGSAWSVTPSGTSQIFTDVWGSRPGDVWAVGVGAFLLPPETLHWNGSAWSGAGPPLSLNGVWGSRSDDVWAVGFGGIQHWNGSDWSESTSAVPLGLSGVWGSGSDDVWAVGSAGTILHH